MKHVVTVMYPALGHVGLLSIGMSNSTRLLESDIGYACTCSFLLYFDLVYLRHPSQPVLFSAAARVACSSQMGGSSRVLLALNARREKGPFTGGCQRCVYKYKYILMYIYVYIYMPHACLPIECFGATICSKARSNTRATSLRVGSPADLQLIERACCTLAAH